jgi:hypothetical protein
MIGDAKEVPPPPFHPLGAPVHAKPPFPMFESQNT